MVGFPCCCCLVALLCLTLCDPMNCSLPGSSSTGFPRQEYWSGLPFSFPRFSITDMYQKRPQPPNKTMINYSGLKCLSSLDASLASDIFLGICLILSCILVSHEIWFTLCLSYTMTMLDRFLLQKPADSLSHRTFFLRLKITYVQCIKLGDYKI